MVDYKSKCENQKKVIKYLKEELEKFQDLNFDIDIGTKIFIESLTYKGEVRTYVGILIKECPKHLKILVGNGKNKYSYIIGKTSISGIKIYHE